MASFVNLVGGTATVMATGPFPERLMNLCAREGVIFWGVQWLDESSLRMTIRLSSVKRVERLSARAGCGIRMESRRGLPHILGRLRRRYAFLLGLSLSLAAVFFLSRIVLVVEVQGNEKVPTAAILTQLRRQGLCPGVYGPRVDRSAVAQEALKQLDGLAWMGVNIQGTRAVVQVREVVPSPEVEELDGFYHIVARTDGVIERVQARQGQAVVEEGTVVARGDVLISGVVTVEPPKFSQGSAYEFATRAQGKVWARTWHTLTAVTPVELTVKGESGREKLCPAVEVLGRRVALYRESARQELFRDGSREELWQLELPGVGTLPLGLRLQRRQSYELCAAQADLTAAQQMLENSLLRRLEDLVGEEGQVLSTRYSARVARGLLQVTVTAECRQEIGSAVPAPESDRPGG